MLESLSFCADNNKQSKVSNLNNLKRELYFLIVSHNRYYVMVFPSCFRLFLSFKSFIVFSSAPPRTVCGIPHAT